MVRAMTKDSVNPQHPANPFGETENKSLESEVTEVKSHQDADVEAEPVPEAPTKPAPEPEDETMLVVMVHHDDYDGKPLVPGHTYRVPARWGQERIATHRANPAE